MGLRWVIPSRPGRVGDFQGGYYPVIFKMGAAGQLWQRPFRGGLDRDVARFEALLGSNNRRLSGSQTRVWRRADVKVLIRYRPKDLIAERNPSPSG